MQITCMEEEFVKTLKLKILVNIMTCILKVIHCLWQMFFKTLEKMCFEIYQLVPRKCFSAPIAKKTNIKLELLTDIDMQ